MTAPGEARRRPWHPHPAFVGVMVAIVVIVAVATVAAREPSEDDHAARTTTTSTPSGQPSTSTSTTAEFPVPDGGSITGAPAARVAELEQIKAQVATVRQLEWRRPLHVELASRPELARKLKELSAEDLEEDRPELEADEATLKMLKLIPARLNYIKAVEDLLAGAVLGFYDDETKKLYIGTTESGRLDPATRSVAVHEMTHALTDQHFDFGTRARALDDAGKTEESAGLIALVEGDAELVVSLWSQRFLSRAEQLDALVGTSGDRPPDVPRYILEGLSFPYVQGAEFVARLHKKGGFGAVDSAYGDPPTSVEQIFHPARYEARQGWAPPPLPDLVAATGCQGVDTGTLGEFDMRHMLAQHMRDNAAASAADGWNGDAFTMVRCGSSRGLADRWRTDEGVDPQRLVGALRRWAKGWSGAASAPDAEGRFSGPSGAGRITQAGSDVEIVLADDAATAQRLEAALAAS